MSCGRSRHISSGPIASTMNWFRPRDCLQNGSRPRPSTCRRFHLFVEAMHELEGKESTPAVGPGVGNAPVRPMPAAPEDSRSLRDPEHAPRPPMPQSLRERDPSFPSIAALAAGRATASTLLELQSRGQVGREPAAGRVVAIWTSSFIRRSHGQHDPLLESLQARSSERRRMRSAASHATRSISTDSRHAVDHRIYDAVRDHDPVEAAEEATEVFISKRSRNSSPRP